MQVSSTAYNTVSIAGEDEPSFYTSLGQHPSLLTQFTSHPNIVHPQPQPLQIFHPHIDEEECKVSLILPSPQPHNRTHRPTGEPSARCPRGHPLPT